MQSRNGKASSKQRAQSSALMVWRAVSLIVVAVFVLGSSSFIAMKITEPVAGQVSTTTANDNAPYVLTDPIYKAELLPRVDLSRYQFFDFAAGRTSEGLISGWSRPEVTGVWSSQRTAFIGFFVTKGEQRHTGFAIVRAGFFLNPPSLNAQTIDVWANHGWIARYSIDRWFEELKVPLSNVSVKDGGPLLFSFSLPDAQQIHPPDPRAIALNLRTLEFIN